MKPSDFVTKYYNDAKACELSTRIPALFTLAQCALETGWAEHAPGNMMFGIKDTDGVNGNEQLITTTEYSRKDTLSFPQIISKVFNPVTKYWKYTVKDYFRKYNSAKESFEDHAKFFMTNARYKDNFSKCGNDPYKWADEVSADGYATGPNYAAQLKAIIKMLESYV